MSECKNATCLEYIKENLKNRKFMYECKIHVYFTKLKTLFFSLTLSVGAIQSLISGQPFEKILNETYQYEDKHVDRTVIQSLKYFWEWHLMVSEAWLNIAEIKFFGLRKRQKYKLFYLKTKCWVTVTKMPSKQWTLSIILIGNSVIFIMQKHGTEEAFKCELSLFCL